MQIKPIAVLKGLPTFIPGVTSLACGGSGGTDSSRYCYAVWLRHLTQLANAGVDVSFESVAELGPGDSLGIGLCAVLTGSRRYFAFDAKAHANREMNLRTLRSLIDLFSRRAEIPDHDEFPELWPPIAATAFPRGAVDEARLNEAMRPERLDAIVRAIESGDAGEVEIRYAAPWSDSSILRADVMDLVFSQAVLEHVEDIDSTYDALFRWLKPGAVMSHQIDFKSHGLTRDWYGHWTVPSWMWRIVRGRRSYLINRFPASSHL